MCEKDDRWVGPRYRSAVSSAAKSALRRVGRNRRFWRRLPDEVGGAKFKASTEGGLRYLTPNLLSIEPELLAFARSYVKPGATVWDVGANLGLFTFAAAGLGGAEGSVLAVDADPWLCEGLRSSARRNDRTGSVSRVSVLNAAVASEVGIAEFHIAGRDRATNALAVHGYRHAMGKVRETQKVLTMTLDWMLERETAPDVIKIDVEGAELDVLAGASVLLSTVRPVLYVEVEDQHRVAVGSLLVKHDYDLIDAKTQQKVAVPTWNVIAVPRG